MEQHAAEQKKSEPEPEPEPKPKPANHAAQHEDAAAAKTPTPPPSSGPEGQQHPPPEPEPSPAQQKSVTWSRDLTQEAPPATAVPAETNPYVSSSPATSSTPKKTMESVKSVLGRWGKKMGEASRKAEDLAGNVWQHLKTGPSMADAAMGRIAQGTKVIAEGGYEKIFQQTFDMLPEEKFKKSYACYLSTSAGPVMGILYLSTAKLAFCSDSPLSYQVGDQTEWTYYKVVILLPQLKAVNPSVSKVKRTEKYIQIVSIDNHEFWFMGFVNYDSAVKNLQEALHCAHDLQPQ